MKQHRTMLRAQRTRGLIVKKEKLTHLAIQEHISQGLAAAGIQALADIFSQLLLGSGLSLFTPFAMGIYGFTTGVICYTVYRKMEKKNSDSSPGVKQALKMMLLDQLIWSPVSTFFFVLYSMLLLPEAVGIKRLMWIFFGVLLNSYKVWPIVQFINFLCVPLHFRVPLISVVSLIWNIWVKITIRMKEGK